MSQPMLDKIWIAAAKAADLPEGEMCAVLVAGRTLALYHVEGRYHATDAICTHGQARLTDGYLDGHMIECPLHQGVFDIRTGKGQGAPISIDLASYPARLAADGVEIEIELDGQQPAAAEHRR